jgi:hypothetical protein
MFSLARQVVDRFVNALPGWLLLLAGLSLLALMLLTPVWMSCQQLAWQHQLMGRQVEQLAAQKQRYQQFNAALARDDPVLIERLAYTHLRLKPVDKAFLTTPGPITRRSRIELAWAMQSASPREPGVLASEPLVLVEDCSVKKWLAASPGQGSPLAGDPEAYKPIQSRLTHLATGHSRLILMIAAVVCLAAGLLPQGRQRTE